MKTIGLTGGIASGKSTVCAMLAQLGAPVFDADKEAHRLLTKGGLAWESIKDRFGDGILAENGDIDRKKLGEIVFSNRTELIWLEGITHGHVEKSRQQFVAGAKNMGKPVAVLDIPLLIEKNIYKKMDEVWLVYLPLPLQTKRLMARDGLTAAQAAKRLAAQMPLAEKRWYAGVIIDNSGGIETTRAKVQEEWQKLMDERR